MQDRLLVLEPGALVAATGYSFPAKARRWPVRLSASVPRDEVRIDLPAGFNADEIPDAVKLESRWGTYAAMWSIRDGKVAFEQSLEVRDTRAPASDYGEIRDFFERVAGAQHAAVVLVKQER
jgi:hypothetical protein